MAIDQHLPQPPNWDLLKVSKVNQVKVLHQPKEYGGDTVMFYALGQWSFNLSVYDDHKRLLQTSEAPMFLSLQTEFLNDLRI